VCSPAADPARGQDGHVGEGVEDPHEERQQVLLPGVAARFVALHGQDVGPAVHRHLGTEERLDLADRGR
jgi:hypothetical protein